jgi:hypothetical protein
VRRVAVVFRHGLGDLRAAVTELGAGAPRFDNGDADPEWGYLLRDRLGEALDAPLGGVVHGVAGEGDLATVGGHLDDPPAALGAQVRQHGPDELDGSGEVGGDDVADLLVGQFLGRAEQPVAGVAGHDVDVPE